MFLLCRMTGAGAPNVYFTISDDAYLKNYAAVAADFCCSAHIIQVVLCPPFKAH